MAIVLITVDTELSAGQQQRGLSARANFESSVLGRCPSGDFGIGWQMETLDRFGLKGVYFVDPIPALVHGEDVIADIVRPIVDAGHEVQLHAHTEWLQWADAIPTTQRYGESIADYSFDDQVRLLDYGCGVLERAGAPRPIAFRAGNYGANDDTLRALAAIGLVWDSSVNAAFLGAECRVDFPAGRNAPAVTLGVHEAPVSGLFEAPDRFRPAQVCALSTWEMRSALDHAAATRHPAFTIVTHSFEMLSRDRARPNRAVTQRFEAMARTIAAHPDLATAGFADLDLRMQVEPDVPRLEPSRVRTLFRQAAQAVATLRYENTLRRA